MSEGYRGYFDLDFLVDRRNGELFLRLAQPTPLRRQPADQQRSLRPRRRPALSVPPAGVRRRRPRPGRRGAERPLGGPTLHRLLELARPEEHRRAYRAGHRGAAIRSLAVGRQGCPLPPLRLPTRGRRGRERRIVPAHHRPRRLALRGRRPGHPRHPRPAHGRPLRADRPGARLDRRPQAPQYASRPVASAGMVTAWSKSPPLAKGDARGPRSQRETQAERWSPRARAGRRRQSLLPKQPQRGPTSLPSPPQPPKRRAPPSPRSSRRTRTPPPASRQINTAPGPPRKSEACSRRAGPKKPSQSHLPVPFEMVSS